MAKRVSDSSWPMLKFCGGGNRIDDISINKEEFTIGSAIENDRVIRDERVSKNHLKIRKEGSTWNISSQAQTGTWLNGDFLVPLAVRPLLLGDRIHLGSAEGILFIFCLDGPDPKRRCLIDPSVAESVNSEFITMKTQHEQQIEELNAKIREYEEKDRRRTEQVANLERQVARRFAEQETVLRAKTRQETDVRQALVGVIEEMKRDRREKQVLENKLAIVKKAVQGGAGTSTDMEHVSKIPWTQGSSGKVELTSGSGVYVAEKALIVILENYTRGMSQDSRQLFRDLVRLIIPKEELMMMTVTGRGLGRKIFPPQVTSGILKLFKENLDQEKWLSSREAHEILKIMLNKLREVQKRAKNDDSLHFDVAMDATSSGVPAIFEQSFTCSICHDLLKETQELGCSHRFCAVCIANWRTKSNTCPTCRTVITNVQAVPVIDETINIFPRSEPNAGPTPRGRPRKKP